MRRLSCPALAILLGACGGPGREDAADTTTGTGATTTTTSPTSSTTATTAADETRTTAADSSTAGSSSGPADGDATTAADTGDDDCLGLDDNGIVQLYCTDPTGAPPWVLGFGDWEDRILRFGEIVGDGAQTEVEASDQVRMTVFAEEPECEGLEDHGLALEQGFMCSALDWTDYELTAYFQLVTASADDANRDFTMYGGGGRHTGDGPPIGCLGSSYKGSLHYVDGSVRFGKESWHVNYDYRDGWIDAGVPDLLAEPDRWVGMKVVRYAFERDGAWGVRNELWLDLAGLDEAGVPSNDWQLATASEDHPDQESWGTQATACGAPVDDQIMLWGGPWVTWRWDDSTARLRLMSVREILPPA